MSSETNGIATSLLPEFDLEMANTRKVLERVPEAAFSWKPHEMFDEGLAGARPALAAASDATFLKSWSLLANGEPLITMPRVAVVRSFVMNHLIHHRAQLCVYLRLKDIPVPALYGPSADEQG